MGRRALLVIADIGGYTRFMRVHRINLAHAQYVVAQLLEAVIDAAEPKLTLAKLEGDAAFFYALLPEKAGAKVDIVATFTNIVAAIRRAFLSRRLEMMTDRVCTCDSCTQAGQLNLKFVAHLGEVAFQKVKRYTELAGVDVIFVHRLLKNTVPVTEYVLMSEPVFERIDDSIKEHGLPLGEHLEGLGDVTNYYVDLLALGKDLPIALEPSVLRKIAAWVKMTLRSIPYFLGFRKSCEGFRNMGDVDPSFANARPGASLPPPPGSTLPPPSLPHDGAR